MTSTVDAIPDDETEWKDVLEAAASLTGDKTDSERKYRPVPEDDVISEVVERGATESAADVQLDIAVSTGDVRRVEEGVMPVDDVLSRPSEAMTPLGTGRDWVVPEDDDGDADDESMYYERDESDDPPVGAHVTVPSGDTDDEDDADGWEQYVDATAEHPVDADRATEVLNAAQEYFRSELEDIHRRGAKSRWGLSAETIDEAGIGFCPDRDDLREHLRDAGFDAVEILATGLFTAPSVKHAVNGCDDPAECGHDVPEDLEMLGAAIRDGDANPRDVDVGAVITRVEESQGVSLYQWWDDRLTIPYRDEDGDVAFFAARATGGTADIVYDDTGNDVAKYVKLAKNQPWTHPSVDEPLFGAAELPDDPDEVIVTEGLTDVLAARQHGYAAFGPATTEFKHDAVENAAEAVENADHVTVIMDNDDPGEDADISPGLNGALKTAAELRAHDVEAGVGVLPRVEGRETDMADYLQTCDADDLLREVLADAKPPREFDAFDPSRHAPRDGDQVTEQGGAEQGSDVGGSAVGGDGEVDSDGEQSALFELTIPDVAGHGVPNSPGDRGPNPFLGELNSTGRHFQVVDEERAYDHHASVKSTYTPLTWLLCDAGVRDPKSPSGELSDEEVFRAWVHAKQEGVIPADDRIPWRARMHVIREHDLMPAVCVPDGEYAPDEVPESVWADVVEVVEEEYGVDAGLAWV